MAGGLITDLGGLISGLIGSGEEQKAYQRAKGYQNEWLDYLKGINPEAENNIAADPAVRTAQMEALKRLQGVADEGGMDINSQVATREAMDTAAAQERGQRGAILANAAQRGTVGGGQQLAAELSAQQAGANTATQAAGQAAADARTRALQAMQAGGNQANQMSASDLAYQRARSDIDAFNARNRLQKGEMLGQPYGNLSNLEVQQGNKKKQDDVAAGVGGASVISDIGGLI